MASGLFQTLLQFDARIYPLIFMVTFVKHGILTWLTFLANTITLRLNYHFCKVFVLYNTCISPVNQNCYNQKKCHSLMVYWEAQFSRCFLLTANIIRNAIVRIIDIGPSAPNSSMFAEIPRCIFLIKFQYWVDVNSVLKVMLSASGFPTDLIEMIWQVTTVALFFKPRRPFLIMCYGSK